MSHYKRMARPKSYSDQQLKKAIAQSSSWGEVCRVLGLTNGSKNRRHVRIHAISLQVDVSHLGTLAEQET